MEGGEHTRRLGDADEVRFDLSPGVCKLHSDHSNLARLRSGSRTGICRLQLTVECVQFQVNVCSFKWITRDVFACAQPVYVGVCCILPRRS